MTTCLTCDISIFRNISNSLCICKVNYQEDGLGNCVPTGTCISGFTYNSSTSLCNEICGDGLLFELNCDDGNNIDGDGCSSICTI
jgi:cysteine-rich repeat protein